mgnify:CR=1 FL=1
MAHFKDAYPELTLTDKLNLANCAARRFKYHIGDGDRSMGEYKTAHLWMRHAVVQTRDFAGKPLGYTLA